MRVISNKKLIEFSSVYPAASVPLQDWHKLIKSSTYRHFADIKAAFNATDKVGDYYVFDIGGNKYRLIAAIHFNRQLLFVRHILTHKEYDRWRVQ